MYCSLTVDPRSGDSITNLGYSNLSQMIYLNDREFRIKKALNILDNQFKCPKIYNECCF